MTVQYLIDSENVGDFWIPLLELPDEQTELFVFYTKNSPHMSYESLIRLKESDKKVSFIKCYEGTNALDFQLVSELGYRICENEEGRFVVVTNDTGYDAAVKYWRHKKRSVKRITGKECKNLERRLREDILGSDSVVRTPRAPKPVTREEDGDGHASKLTGLNLRDVEAAARMEQEESLEADAEAAGYLSDAFEAEMPAPEAPETVSADDETAHEMPETAFADGETAHEMPETAFADDETAHEMPEATFADGETAHEMPETVTADSEAALERPKTDMETEEAAFGTPQSTAESEEPVFEAAEAAAKSEEPVFEAAEAAAKSEEPVFEAAEAAAESGETGFEAAEFAIESDEPVVEMPQIAADTAEAVPGMPEAGVQAEEAVHESPETDSATEWALSETAESGAVTEEAVPEMPETGAETEESGPGLQASAAGTVENPLDSATPASETQETLPVISEAEGQMALALPAEDILPFFPDEIEEPGESEESGRRSKSRRSRSRKGRSGSNGTNGSRKQEPESSRKAEDAASVSEEELSDRKSGRGCRKSSDAEKASGRKSAAADTAGENSPAHSLNPLASLQPTDEEIARIAACIGADNLAELHNQLATFYGEQGKDIYLSIKNGTRNLSDLHPDLKQKFCYYCEIIFAHSEDPEEVPPDMADYLLNIREKLGNLNSLRYALIKHYGKEKGRRYYFLLKPYAKAMHQM